MRFRRCAAQGESHGHGREFIAGPDSFRAEAQVEDPPDGGNEGRSSGQEDHVDVAAFDAARFQQRVDAGFDLRQLFGDPLLEIVSPNNGIELHKVELSRSPGSTNRSSFSERICVTGSPGLLRPVQSERLFYSGKNAWVLTLCSMFMTVPGAQKGQVMPAFQLEVNPVGNRKDLVHRPHLGPGAEGG